MRGASEGAVTLFIRHTSASLTIQENADPSVLDDLMTALDRLAPEDAGWSHDTEGPDDMPAHVKTMLTATSLHIPVLKGELALGTWQAIYLIEHRTRPHRREIVLQFIGATCLKTKPAAERSAAGWSTVVWAARRKVAQVLVMSTSLVSGRNRKPTTRLMMRDADRIPQAGIDVSGRGHDRKHRRGQEAAEPAVADMVGQRHAAVADAAREQFNQPCRDRRIDQRHIDHQHPEHAPSS